MDASDHPAFDEESAYLQRVVERATARLQEVATLGWSGGVNSAATVALGNHFARQEDALRNVLRRPYFGRFDRAHDASCDETPETIYIGEQGLLSLVTDWRAPIAQHFYHPDRRTRLKRRFTIAASKLKDISDDLVRPARTSSSVPALDYNGGMHQPDAALREALSRSRGVELDSIVATIASHQYDLIRSPAKVLTIQGSAGTGKTVVALHRLAYLLFESRQQGDRQERTRVAIFGPNRIFLRYIEAVLPRLGENDVVQTTFADWFREWCGADAPAFRDIDAELEFMLRHNVKREQRAPGFLRSRIKGSARMKAALERYVALRRQRVETAFGSAAISVPSAISEAGEPIRLDVAELHTLVQGQRSRPLNKARRTLEDQIGDRLRARMSDSGRADRVRIEVRRRLDDVWPIAPIADVYRDFISRIMSDPLGLSAPESALVQSSDLLSMEDVGPMAYLKLLVDGPTKQFGHIVIDEAQDFSPLEYAVLLAHTTGLTAVGDIAQGIHSYRGLRSWDEVGTICPDIEIQHSTLPFAYRSTSEITEIANRILVHIPGSTSVGSFSRSGVLPTEARTPTSGHLAAVIQSFWEDATRGGLRTLAILTRSATDAATLFPRVKAALPVTSEPILVMDRNDTRAAAVMIMPAYLAKGMEFDAVALVNADAGEYMATEYDAKLLYIAATRALHRLLITWCSARTELLSPRSDITELRAATRAS